MSLATPQLLPCAMHQKNSVEALTELLTVLHISMGLHALVMVRQINKNQLCITRLFYDNVIQLLRGIALAECFPCPSHGLRHVLNCSWVSCRRTWIKLTGSLYWVLIIWSIVLYRPQNINLLSWVQLKLISWNIIYRSKLKTTSWIVSQEDYDPGMVRPILPEI